MSKRKRAEEIFIKKSTACLFCKRFTDDEVDFGGLKRTKNLDAHYYCLLQSETIEQSGPNNKGIFGFLPEDILNEFSRSVQKLCCYCEEYGATLACGHEDCNRKFHLPCGIIKNTQYDFNVSTNYCDVHRKPSNVPRRIKKFISSYQCMICLENFDDNTRMSRLVWANCCKSDVILHIRCIKQMALSTGCFTKCPGCNNQDKFINTIKSYGVFVPERGLSWELDENAFAELQCDIKKCICPRGKMYSEKQGKWLIRLCNLCGLYGAHYHCSRVRKNITCYKCNSKNRISLANTSFDDALRSIDSAIATSSNPSCFSPRTRQSNDPAVVISKERSSAACSNKSTSTVVADKSSSKKICRPCKSTTQISRKRALEKQDKKHPAPKRSMSDRSTPKYIIPGIKQEKWTPAKPGINTDLITNLDNQDLTNGLNMAVNKVQNIVPQHCLMPDQNTKIEIDGIQDIIAPIIKGLIQAQNEEEHKFKSGKLHLQVDMDELRVVAVSRGCDEVDESFSETGGVLMNSEGTVCVPAFHSSQIDQDSLS